MAASPTGWHFKNRARRPSIGRVSTGRQFERIAALYCLRQGWRIFKKNRWWGGGEIDLIVWSGHRWLILEVRGCRHSKYAPRETLSFTKRQRLLRFSRFWASQHKAPTEIRLIEIIGNPWLFWIQLGTPWYRNGPWGTIAEFAIEEN